MSEAARSVIKQLGAGLILRRSSPADAEALSALCGVLHTDGSEESNPYIAAWTRDLLTRPHPTFHADDFTIVEETATGRIVSTLNLISQTWSYEGIEFGVGRPELVGTRPEFRNRGLIRLQMEEVHQWSAARGELVQAITGIPFYYRLFGYEMALDLDGARTGFELNVPSLKQGETEAYGFRRATEADIPFIEETYRHGCRRYPIACIRDRDVWRHEMLDQSEIYNSLVMIIERTDGEQVGILRHLPHLAQHGPSANLYELKPGVSWLDVTPSVVRYLWKTGKEYGIRDGIECSAFTFVLGEAHPVYEALKEGLPRLHRSYAWYLRVPDLPAFVQHIAPALENRLAGSIAVGYSGEQHISFYREGMRLVFEHGKLTGAEPWQPGPKEQEGDAAFPGLTFLQLLFGYRSLEELKASFADCWWKSDETRAVLEALFPKKPSQVMPVS